jgi:hypothetical protein
MITAILTVLGGLLAVGVVYAKWWVENSPERKKAQRDEEIRQGRTDIVEGNTDAVSVRIDELCSENPSCDAKLNGDQDTARRLQNLTGVQGVGPK